MTRVVGHITAPGQFHLPSILSKVSYRGAGNILSVFYVSTSLTRVSVCTPRDGRQLEGVLEEKTERPRDKNTVLLSGGTRFGEDGKSCFYSNTVLLWRTQNPLTFLRQDMNFVSGRLFLILLSDPFPTHSALGSCWWRNLRSKL